MKIPFSTGEFLEVFEKYNNAVFPAQIFINLLALLLIFFAFHKIQGSGKIISASLALLWLWMGIVYHILFFTAINKAAYIFGSLFIIQGALFIYEGIKKKKLAFEFRKNIFSVTGLIFITYALIIYPVIGFYSGHVYPKAPTFGLPCPTVIFTFGLILLSNTKVRLYIIVIPFLWSLLGSSAALYLGIKEDLWLLAAGLITPVLIIMHNKKINSSRQ